jgi:hypothetical protein
MRMPAAIAARGDRVGHDIEIRRLVRDDPYARVFAVVCIAENSSAREERSRDAAREIPGRCCARSVRPIQYGRRAANQGPCSCGTEPARFFGDHMAFAAARQTRSPGNSGLLVSRYGAGRDPIASSASVLLHVSGPGEAGNGPEILVNGPQLMIGQMPQSGPGHDLQHVGKPNERALRGPG